jgi:hypothetical protein
MPACAGAKQPLRGRKAIVELLNANVQERGKLGILISVYSV